MQPSKLHAAKPRGSSGIHSRLRSHSNSLSRLHRHNSLHFLPLLSQLKRSLDNSSKEEDRDIMSMPTDALEDKHQPTPGITINTNTTAEEDEEEPEASQDLQPEVALQEDLHLDQQVDTQQQLVPRLHLHRQEILVSGPITVVTVHGMKRTGQSIVKYPKSLPKAHLEGQSNLGPIGESLPATTSSRATKGTGGSSTMWKENARLSPSSACQSRTFEAST